MIKFVPAAQTVRFTLRNGAFHAAERCVSAAQTVRFSVRNSAFQRAEQRVSACGTARSEWQFGQQPVAKSNGRFGLKDKNKLKKFSLVRQKY